MARRRASWLIVAIVMTAAAITAALFLQNRIPGARGRQSVTRDARVRQLLFAEIQPVTLANCTLERFGEPNDGGYLLCSNLLDSIETGYSYGISGYDGWGCDVSRRFRVNVHQYDCFDTRAPSCPGGNTVFHAECIGATAKTDDGRLFDTLRGQVTRNGDAAKRAVVKMDVEGAEWDSLLTTPDDVLQRIDQLDIEFHDVSEESIAVVQRLKQFFYVTHLHFNNFSCRVDMAPFPAWAYEVLFVNKRLGRVDGSGAAPVLDRLDAPNNPKAQDCQVSAR